MDERRHGHIAGAAVGRWLWRVGFVAYVGLVVWIFAGSHPEPSVDLAHRLPGDGEFRYEAGLWVATSVPIIWLWASREWQLRQDRRDERRQQKPADRLGPRKP